MFKQLLTTALLCLCSFSLAHSADHLDAPILTGRGDLDVNDVYAFQSPTNANNTVLIMTVNPFCGHDERKILRYHGYRASVSNRQQWRCDSRRSVHRDFLRQRSQPRYYVDTQRHAHC